MKLNMKRLTQRTSLLMAVIFLTITACTPQEERLQSSGVNSEFNFDTGKTFEEYVNYSQKIIRLGRVDLNSANEDEIVSWNSPFILNPNDKNCFKNNKKGILLIHGLSDSPFTTRTMANYFSKNCFTVYSILLTGHGTRPGDLLKVSYKDWVKQVEYGVKELSKKADKIYLGGFSAGGALAVNYALSNPAKEIDGIIALSPAFNLDGIAALAPIAKYFKKYTSVYEDKNFVKYESFTINAAAQIYLLTKEIAKKLKESNVALQNTGMFVALTYEDHTINPEKTLNTIVSNTNPDKRHIILYHKYDLPEEIINQKNLYPIKSSIVENKIFDLAHISLPNDSKNIWYGKDGKYRSCLHYYGDKDYALCQSSNDVYYGEITKDNLNRGLVVRLSYNPFIEQLFIDLGNFLEI